MPPRGTHVSRVLVKKSVGAVHWLKETYSACGPQEGGGCPAPLLVAPVSVTGNNIVAAASRPVPDVRQGAQATAHIGTRFGGGGSAPDHTTLVRRRLRRPAPSLPSRAPARKHPRSRSSRGRKRS